MTSSTQSGGDKQKEHCSRLTSFTPAPSQRELAAKSVSELNNSITDARNTHTTLLKPGLFRGEEFIDFKLLPLGPSPLIAGKKKKKEGAAWRAMTVAQWDASVQTSAPLTAADLCRVLFRVWFLLTSNLVFLQPSSSVDQMCHSVRREPLAFPGVANKA